MAVKYEEDNFQSVRTGELVNLTREGFNGVVKVVGITKEYHGSAKAKSRVEVVPIISAEGVPERLFVKKVSVEGRTCFGGEEVAQTESVRYYERWKFCKNIGLPTLDEMWVVDEGRVAMEDKRADGGMFFGKHKYGDLQIEAQRDVKRKLTAEEEYFLEMDVDDIVTKFNEWQDVALKHMLLFSLDDPMDLFVDKEDNNWGFYLVDLDNLEDSRGNEYGYEYNAKTIRNYVNMIRTELEKVKSVSI